MNHKYNTSGYILSNYLVIIFLPQTASQLGSGRRQSYADPPVVLSCVMPCRNPEPRHPIRIPRPDPNDLITFQDHQRRLLEGSGSSVVLCYV